MAHSTECHQCFDRLASKRKLDDYGPSDDDFSDLVPVRMKKDESSATQAAQAQVHLLHHNQQHLNSNSNSNSISSNSISKQLTHNSLDSLDSVVDSEESSSSSVPARASLESSTSSSTKAARRGGFASVGRSLHFFVRMMPRGNTTVMHANSEDSVDSIHEQIERMTGIPVYDQGLIYMGKQLQGSQTLAECKIQNDAGLQLVSRMRSTQYPKSWQVVNDLVYYICRLCREGDPYDVKMLKARAKDFLKMTPNEDVDQGVGHVQVFKSARVPEALVMLFLSPISGNKECAEEAIRLFLYPHLYFSSNSVQSVCAPIVLEFCKLLRKSCRDDPLYVLCRNSLGTMLESIGSAHTSKFFEHGKASSIIQEIFPFIRELEERLSTNLMLDTFCCTTASIAEVRTFGAFLHPLRLAIVDQVGGDIPVKLRQVRPCYVVEVGTLHLIFLNLLGKVDECLKRVEEALDVKGAGEIQKYQLAWSQYLFILKHLNSISILYPGAEEKIRSIMKSRSFAVNTLLMYAKRTDDHSWLFKYKDVTNFESRRHLAMLMLPEVKDDFEELHEMLIDRSNLVSESFEYIAHTDSETLHGGLFMEFKNEEATGPGVLREWFCLLCQALFNPQNPLFLVCPNDHRRFFPNPASYVENLHLDYFGFCGRIMALALMHKVQIGVLLDRAFFLQLAGKCITLEDVRDADPCLYMSCKKILEMDAEFLDSDALGLTFVREIEELGSRRVVELCQGGQNISLNSKNREAYVNLLIQHRFVTSVSHQVLHFAEGFSEILCNPRNRTLFFQSLELEDLDQMLYGSKKEICIKDWKAHTEYSSYTESDSQISWFWKIVEEMSAEQQRVLLFFWTSVKYLPVEGFGGLQSMLSIYKGSESPDHLPTSHTCFYRLSLPVYPSIEIMRNRLQTISQEHVSCSFGNW